ncbi:centromere/kinetochore protein, putative (ZW10) isoform X2 [Wolffia australiana]
MDVLFGSIDVRELLPAAAPSVELGNGDGDHHEATPLSAPDLRLIIDRLGARSQQIKDRVRDYLISNRAELSLIFSQCSDVASCSESVAEVIAGAMNSLSYDRAVDVQIREIANELALKKREIEEKRIALIAVKEIAAVWDRLEAAKVDCRACRFTQAAEILREMKAALLIVDEDVVGGRESGEDPTAYRVLRREWFVCLDELQVALVTLVGNAVRFKVEDGVLEVRSWVKASNSVLVELQRVLRAMDTIGSLHYGLAKVADLMIKNAVSPIICEKSMTLHTEELSSDSAEKGVAILKLLPSDEPQESVDSRAIYSRLLLAIEFIQKYVLFEDTKWIFYFSRLTWSRISELVITFFLSEVAPENTTKSAEFQKIIRYTTEFEASLKKIGFLSENDNEGEKLSIFAADIEVKFASQKRKDILATARSLILECDFSFPSECSKRSVTHDSDVSNTECFVDLLFGSETCFVSKAAVQLMKLVHQVLKDVSMSSSRVGMELYHAARDALLLYKAIIPVKLEKPLGTISQAAVIVHNDCLYLSQEISALSFQYRGIFPSGVKDCAVFVDIAPNYRQMAEEALWKQVQLVYFNIKEAVDGANGFQNTHQFQQYESAKFSLDQVFFILEKMHVLWEQILPTSVYKGTMRLLLDFAFKSILGDLLLLDDIGADETLQLQKLIFMFLENLSSLFESLVDDSSGIDTWTDLNEKVASLGKLRKLADMLDMSLKGITEEWESGELVRCGFTLAEVQSLIRGIFTESPIRKECLARIQSNHLN